MQEHDLATFREGRDRARQEERKRLLVLTLGKAIDNLPAAVLERLNKTGGMLIVGAVATPEGLTDVECLAGHTNIGITGAGNMPGRFVGPLGDVELNSARIVMAAELIHRVSVELQASIPEVIDQVRSNLTTLGAGDAVGN